MKPVKYLLVCLLLVFACQIDLFAQTNGQEQPRALSRDYVVEVTYYKGRQLAFQRIGEGAWYELFPRIADWKPAQGQLPVAAVRISPREDGGQVKVKVSVLRGPNHEIEDQVTETSIGATSTAVKELIDFGVAPFELKLVRAPSTVAQLPAITNETKSLVVSVEPAVSTLPSFKAKFLNSSAKPVIGLSYRTSIKDETKLIGMPQDRKGGVLIAPGATYELTLRYPLNRTIESNGEVPQAQIGLQLNVLAVMYQDGSYEGNGIQAARFRGYKLGEKIQLTRIIELLRSADAGSAATLAPKAAALSYRISAAEVGSLATVFPGISAEVLEDIRSAAEVSANDIQKDFRGTFGGRSPIDPTVFPDAVKAAIAQCERWVNFLP